MLPLGLFVDTSRSLTWEYLTRIRLLRAGVYKVHTHLKRVGKQNNHTNKGGGY